MCTSIFYQTKDKTHFLARTLDFAQELNLKPTVVKKGYHFKSQANQDGFDTKFSFIGAGANDNFADGVNENGLAIASLYFNENAAYNDEKIAGQVNLASPEVVPWVLGNIKSVADFKSKVYQINICNIKNKFVNSIMPLHWIIYDRSNEAIVFEMTKTGKHIYENPVGVMTNSPTFDWQLTNLSHYSHLKPTEAKAGKFGDFQIVSDGPGTGAVGLPGDYTSTSRFVRTAFLREYTDQAQNTEEGVNTLIHIINNVDIPKGVKIGENGLADYTQYKGIMDLDHLTYYYLPYKKLEIEKATL